MTALDRVLRECERWGVPVVGGLAVGSITHHAPTLSGGIDWKRRRIVLLKRDLEERTIASALLHELAHVIVGEDPRWVDEVRDMLAFEFYEAKRLRLRCWSEWMKSYSIGEDWPDATEAERRECVADSLTRVQEIGLLDERNRPTYRRVPAPSRGDKEGG